MKSFKKLIIILVSFFTLILSIGLFLALSKVCSLPYEFSYDGFSFLTSHFNNLNGVFTITIALLSTYFILFQMESIQATNNHTEKVLGNETNNKTIEQSFYFYTKLQPEIKVTFSLVENSSAYLLNQKWNIDEFTDHSIAEQNLNWENEFKKLDSTLENKVTNILNQFESLSASILYGNVDKSMAFDLFGRPYLRQIQYLYPFISAYRSREKKSKEDNYSCIVELYNQWNSKN